MGGGEKALLPPSKGGPSRWVSWCRKGYARRDASEEARGDEAPCGSRRGSSTCRRPCDHAAKFETIHFT